MDKFMMELKEIGELREEIPVVSSSKESVIFESPIAGDNTKCNITKEAYILSFTCGICEDTIGNILLLMCKRMNIVFLNAENYRDENDIHVIASIIISLKMCNDDEEYFMRILKKMDIEDMRKVFFDKDYMHFKMCMEEFHLVDE